MPFRWIYFINLPYELNQLQIVLIDKVVVVIQFPFQIHTNFQEKSFVTGPMLPKPSSQSLY